MHFNGTLKPSQRYFMKHIIVFLVIILSSCLRTYAEDDDWIDGITYRLKVYHSSLEYNYVSPLTGEQHRILTSSANGSFGVADVNAHTSDLFEGSSMSFPIAIAFKENLMNAWSYRQAYIDFIFEIFF